jgi:hypothetical protein
MGRAARFVWFSHLCLFLHVGNLLIGMGSKNSKSRAFANRQMREPVLSYLMDSTRIRLFLWHSWTQTLSGLLRRKPLFI